MTQLAAANLYPAGSEWRKWDLHIHTPFSTLNNQFGSDFEFFAKRLLEEAWSKQIAAIGVTDYFSIEGYRRLKALVGDSAWLTAAVDEGAAAHAKRILLLPNVELRGFVVAGEGGRDSRVNYHILFSDALTPDEIDEHFLRRLQFTASSGAGRADERWALSLTNLADLGRRLKEQHSGFDQPDLEVGMMNAVVSHEDVTRVLEEQRSRFEGNYLLVAPSDEDLSDLSWDGQGHLARKLLIQKSHMLFSGNPGTRAFGLGLKHPRLEEFVAEFGPLKPCIHGSDAHSYESLFEPDEHRYTWIKADPTWRGLAMLLNEPYHRVHIGSLPAELERFPFRAAKTIGQVVMERSIGATTQERWFDSTVVLNPGLCAVIGRRGNGKSALAEIIGLLGNTPRTESFSFLSMERFRHPRVGKADQFAASLRWRDGAADGPRTLAQDPPPASVEKVKYIAQGYLEEICNEIGRGDGSRFYSELQDVIFSHVSNADRQGHPTLASLLDNLGEGINERIDLVRAEMADINRRILEIGTRLEPSFKARLDAQHDELLRQLAAHDAAKPGAVLAPEEDAATIEAAADQQLALEGLRADAARLEAELEAARVEDATIARRRTTAERLLERVRTIESQVRRLFQEGGADAAELGVDLRAIVRFAANATPLEDAIRAIDERRAVIRVMQDPEEEASPEHRRAARLVEIRGIEDQLSLPQRLYQEHIRAVGAWETARQRIVGDENTPGTINHVVAQIATVQNLPETLRGLQRRRRRTALEIYRQKQRLRRHYETYHRPVSDFLAGSPVAASESFRLAFTASVTEAGFADGFLRLIDQRRQGPFSGVDEGLQRLTDMLNQANWSSARSVVRFAERIATSMLSLDGRTLRIDDQVRQGVVPSQLLDYVFGLGYTKPTYSLTWDDKDVSELSPGERGNLLLIFYLLVDRNDIPLVVDQPEENLDNQTIVRTLVPCMRDARQRRQILVVTHNPNLAVVCDADQVIYAEIRKTEDYAVVYETGSIEAPAMNRRLVDVLEGTMPAFDQRAAKYFQV